MGLPADQDRELWRKATQNPDQITAEERRSILRLVDPTTQVANAFKISGMTPEELENKALTNPESLTEAECRLLQHGYHIWDPQEYIANSSLDWSFEDNMARIHAVAALKTPEEQTLSTAVIRRSNFFAEERAKARKVTMAKVAEEIDKPCKWVRKLIDPSVPITQQTRRWGLVILRDATTECSNEVWEAFLKQLDNHVRIGLGWLIGGSTINQTRQLIWRDGVVNKGDRDGLYRAFQETLPSGDSACQYILSNTFLLVTPDVMSSFADGSPSIPWIWAYETNFVPSATPIVVAGGKKYEGRLKVTFTSLLTWFYAARSEEFYSMEAFWEKAQNQPNQAWDVGTTMGRYHGPLVLLEKGSQWPFNTYEFENEA